MQLDKTALVIEQRSADELFDLSLVLLRSYWYRVVTIAIVGALPFFLLNWFLLQPQADFDRLVMSSRSYGTREGYIIRHLWLMAVMVYLQAPLAMAGVTYFLGQAVFIEEPTLRQIWKSVSSRWIALAWILGILRGGLVSLLYMAWVYWDVGINAPLEISVVVTVYALLIYLVRGFRPFAAEILLLERCPIRNSAKPGGNELVFKRRSQWLHSGSGDLFSVQIGLTLIAICFVTVFTLGGLFIVGVLIGLWSWGWWANTIIVPVVLWMMATWGTVIRFLLYLNTRIRSEGWEVELKLKAESLRLLEAL